MKRANSELAFVLFALPCTGDGKSGKKTNKTKAPAVWSGCRLCSSDGQGEPGLSDAGHEIASDKHEETRCRARGDGQEVAHWQLGDGGSPGLVRVRIYHIGS